jgi:DNA-binding CsgD family transcriptional regulator
MASSRLVEANGVELKTAELSSETDISPRLLVQHILGLRCDITLHEVDGQTMEFLFDAALEGVRIIIIRPRPATGRPQVLLSPREREIARMVAKGYPNKTIAAVLDISSWTVCTYLRRLFAKLNVCSRAAMVARLIEEGLLGGKPPEAPPSLPHRRS